MCAAKQEWAMDPQALEQQVREDKAAGLTPCLLSGTLGTTSSCAVDPLDALGDLAQRHGMWCACCCCASLEQGLLTWSASCEQCLSTDSRASKPACSIGNHMLSTLWTR